ncbi:DUF1904 family protein [Paenibacillus sp. PAMC21692]|uniref:DUF1904 family protein n=1 Tax=Paenibacillus sp. PAMC21692 TaxID=2762320 RepID=UPI00164E7CDF|nr:DUF1904 family protein [Paenibacillus sp. PAMC21692]QNK55057.1 DUF1904 family protein [Paenibacillus sp. PAMC21692]
MPHLLFRGVPAEKLQTAALPMAERLAALCGCGTDNFTLNALQITNVFGAGPGDPPFVFVEVGWFERGGETRAAFARVQPSVKSARSSLAISTIFGTTASFVTATYKSPM